MKVEILGTGCPSCQKLYELTQEAVKELEIDVEIEKVEDLDRITDYGVILTPGFVVDGKVRSSGNVLSVNEIKKIITQNS
ncbi:thioredoxin family protein [candidate division KSB1 bacterium]